MMMMMMVMMMMMAIQLTERVTSGVAACICPALSNVVRMKERGFHGPRSAQDNGKSNQ
jgi:hypothetical protein